MRERCSRSWRVFATGLSFAAFGLGGLLLRIAVFPVLNLLVWRHQKRIMFARHVIRLTFRAFVGFMQCLGVLRYEIIGRQYLERGGLLILANHPTLIDTVFLMAFVQRAGCVVKGALWSNPFTHGPVRAAGYINNDQGEHMVAECIAALRSGSNLIIFPEGTRTPACGAMTFKRGAANIAIRGVCDVTPVLINCKPMTLGKGEKWWSVPKCVPQFRIEVREDIKINHVIADDMSEVMAVRQLTKYLETYFTKETQQHA